MRRPRVLRLPAPAGRAPSVRVRGRGAGGGDARGSALRTVGSQPADSRAAAAATAGRPDGRRPDRSEELTLCGAAAAVVGNPMSRGTMPQPGAWSGASCAEKLAREAGAVSPGPVGAAAREGGKAAAGGQPRAPVGCPAEQ